MTLPVLPDAQVRVTLGVDTHADVHVAVALDQLGRRLGMCSVPATPAGSAQLLGWASHLGPLQAAGIEGTGSWGVGLARFLRAQGVAVLEVNRPSRQGRRRSGKSDPVDAEAAARAVQAGTATARAKTADGQVEMLRTLRLTRRSAVKARTQAANQLQSLVVTAPDELRQQLRGLPLARLVQAAARLRPGRQPATILAASKLALRSVAVRYLQLSEEIAVLDGQLDRLVKLAAPALLAVRGVGTDTAVALLVAAGDNPDRLHSEAAFAHLCGGGADPGLLGQGDAPPAAPGRQPRRQPGAVGDRHGPDALGRTHPRLCDPAHRRGQEQAGDRPLPHWGTIPVAARGRAVASR